MEQNNSQQNAVTLSLINGTWMAKHTGPHAAEVVDLFETDTLPTPFTQHMAGADVLRQIKQSMGDGVVVTLAA